MTPSPTTATPEVDLDLEPIATRYFAAWARRDPDAIAALHTEGTQFWLRDGGNEPVRGREAVREAFAAMFALLPEFAADIYRVLYGPGFWVLDWAVTARVDGRQVRFDAVDVVNVSADGLVARKDTFVDHTQMQAALAPAAARAAS